MLNVVFAVYTAIYCNCRLSLAILYHNENVKREGQVYKTGDRKGQQQWRIVRSKDSKLQPVAKKLLVKPTFGECHRFRSDVIALEKTYLICYLCMVALARQDT